MPPPLNEATAVYVGAAPAQAVYLGDVKVWPQAPPGVRPDTVAGLVGWWMATDLTGLTDGARIAAWPARVGPTARETATATQPTYRANPPAVEFRVPDRTRLSEGLDGVWPPSAQTVFAVVNGTGWSTNPTIIGRSSTNGGAFQLRIATTGAIGVLAASQAGVAQSATLTLQPNAWHVAAARYNGTDTVRFGLDGATEDQPAGVHTFRNEMNIGHNEGHPEETWDGRIAQIVRYSTVLSDTDFVAVMQWLSAHRSGVTP